VVDVAIEEEKPPANLPKLIEPKPSKSLKAATAAKAKARKEKELAGEVEIEKAFSLVPAATSRSGRVHIPKNGMHVKPKPSKLSEPSHLKPNRKVAQTGLGGAMIQKQKPKPFRHIHQIATRDPTQVSSQTSRLVQRGSSPASDRQASCKQKFHFFQLLRIIIFRFFRRNSSIV